MMRGENLVMQVRRILKHKQVMKHWAFEEALRININLMYLTTPDTSSYAEESRWQKNI